MTPPLKTFDSPLSKRESRRLGHSCRNRLAPVREPSPPITTKLVIPFSTKFLAAFCLPRRSLKSVQRAEPMTVPP